MSRKPDVVALQEVIPSTAPKLAALLARGGLSHVAVANASSGSIGRRYSVLLASRFPLSATVPQLSLPWPEKSLSAIIDYYGDPVEIHTVYIPPGSSNGWTKVYCLEAVFQALAIPSPRHRILCGDFNTPQFELATPFTVTWGQKLDSGGRVRTRRVFRRGSGQRWDLAERNVLTGLAQFDLPDVFRALHGYGMEAYSWVLHRKGVQVRRRFDHVFATRKLNPVRCQYLHEFRETGLSDHAPIEVEFQPPTM